MARKPVGTAYAEIDLDSTKIERGLKRTHDALISGSIKVEDSYKSLGIKSDQVYNMMRANAVAAVDFIKNKTISSTEEIKRAQEAAANKIKQINEQQYGHQATLIEGLKKNWIAASAAIVAAWYAVNKVVGAISGVVLAAARYETLGIVMRVVGNNAGYTGEQMEDLAKALEKTGISMSGSRQALTRMAQAQLDLTKATQLGRVAQDAAVIGNINSTEAFQRLVYGIQSAQVEMLRTIGINVSFENSYQKVAKETGRVATSFSESEKAAIRMNAVLKAGEGIAGTYEAAMETAGKQLLSLERHFENLKVLIGLAFTPALAEIVETITWAITGLNKELSGDSKKAIEEWGVRFRVTLIDIEIAFLNLAVVIETTKRSLKILLMLVQPDAFGGLVTELMKIKEYSNYIEKIEKNILELTKKQLALEESLTDAGKARAKAAADELEKKRLAASAAARAAGAVAEVDEKAAKKRAKEIEDFIKGQTDLEQKLRDIEVGQIEDSEKKEIMASQEKYKDLYALAFKFGINMNRILELQTKEEDAIRKKYGDKRLKDEEKLEADSAAISNKNSEDFYASLDIYYENLRKQKAEEDAAYEKYKQDQIYKAADLANFYAEIAGYEDEFRKNVFDWIDKEAKRRAELYEDEVAAAKWARDEKLKFDAKVSEQKLGNIAEGMGASADAFEQLSRLYSEDSNERKRLHEVAMVFAVAEKAALTAQAIVTAVNAIATQGMGDPYTAFVRIAMMAAMMASLLASAGIAFGGGGGASAPPEKPASTVLGAAPGTGSESIAKMWELLQDTYKMEYRELHGIYETMQELNSNITGLVKNIIQGGGKFDASTFVISEGKVKGFAQSFFEKYFHDFGFIGGPLSSLFIKGLTGILNKITFGVSGWITDMLGNIVGKIFGGETKTSVVAAGIEIGKITVKDLIEGMGVGARQYAKIKTTTEGGWFSSDKTSYSMMYKALDEDVVAMLTKVYKNISETLVELAKGLGTSVEDAMNYLFPMIRINLKGKSAEQIDKILSEYFSNIGDKAAEVLFEVYKGYQKVGEGFLETAMRLVIDKEVILDTLKMTNQSFSAIDTEIIGTRTVINEEWKRWKEMTAKERKEAFPEGKPEKFITETFVEGIDTATMKTVAFSEALIEMAGGIDKLREYAENYYDAFFTDAEKQIRLQGQLTEAFTDMNLVLPDAREGYRALLEGLDLTTESGQEAYVTLLNLAGWADAYYNYLEEAAEEAAEAAERRLREQQSLISYWVSITQENLSEAQTALRSAFEAEKNILTETAQVIISDLKSNLDKLRSARDRMQIEDESFARSQYYAAKATLAAILQQARMGDLSGVKDIDKTLDVLTGSSIGLFSSFVDYQRDYWKTYQSISELEHLTEHQLTAEEKFYEDQIAALDSQMNALLNINTSVLSIAEAIERLSIAMGAATAATAAAEKIKKVTGEIYYGQYMGTGGFESYEAYAAEIKRKLEGNIPFVDPGAAEKFMIDHPELFAAGGSFGGGWRVVGEQGPELEYTGPSNIFSNQKSKALVDNVILISEVRKLREEMKQGNFQIAKNTGKMAKINDRWDSDGLPSTRSI